MASDGPPGADSNVDFNAWTHGELQAKLAEFGAPNMGPREELIDRLKSYAQSGMILTKPNMSGGDAKSMTTMPGLPPMPPMPSMPLPPGMNMMQAMNMMGGPPPIHMGIEPPGMMQHDDRAAQGDARVMDEQMKEQELLEQQRRAAVLLEHERQQELAKIQQGAAPGPRGPELGPRPNLLPPIPPLRVGTLSGPAPPGVSMMPQSVNQRQKVPPPPGEDGRESWQGEDVGIGPKIPQALEKILQLKEMRQEQLSIAPTEEDNDEHTGEMDMNRSSARGFSDEDDESGLSKKDKNRKRRNRKKKNKKKRQQEKEQQEEEKKKEESRDKEPEVEIEYVTEEPAIYDPSYIIFKRIFETFKLTDDLKKEKEKEPEKPEKPEILSFKKKGFELEKKDSDDSDEENKKDMPKLSKKKLRRMNRLTVAELKQNLKICEIFILICVCVFQGCSFGYHAGGWGKPPVDETGRPLYGDVFGTNAIDFQAKAEEEEVDRTPWGELEASDEESSEEEEEEESDEEKPDETGFFTPADSGMITPGGFSSVPAGMETPELIELRKKKIEEAMDGNETPQLFTVLPERKAGAVGAAMMASTHIYDMSTVRLRARDGCVSQFVVSEQFCFDKFLVHP
ncbi:splicing factor 3B subunit 2-like [Sinocyclocheilus grahami]|uniref:splicing factor 3B subunit 2-like n=1 Tax=Sinocyclocheilus grahami TaxID=75366 RepID=UPI0007AD3148|nr:PREDICTED: splicing factor 3B subunit 2-like [Sinocyclocheilus grahami]